MPTTVETRVYYKDEAADALQLGSETEAAVMAFLLERLNQQRFKYPKAKSMRMTTDLDGQAYAVILMLAATRPV